MIAFSSSSVFGSWPAMAATARAGSRRVGKVGSRAIIALVRPAAARTRAGIAAVSGMLRQYFFGISARIAFRLVRAGLKVLS